MQKTKKLILPILLLCVLAFVLMPKSTTAYAYSEKVQAKVFGTISTKIEADYAEVFLNVTNIGKTESEAKTSVLNSFKKLSEELEPHNIKLKTNNFYVRANMEYNNQNVASFSATLNCCLMLEDLTKFDTLLELTTHNDSKLCYMNFYSSHANEEYQKILVEAKNRAVENAKNLLGSEIVVLKIEEISNFYNPCLYRSLSVTDENLELNSEIEMTATVQIKCETI